MVVIPFCCVQWGGDYVYITMYVSKLTICL